MKERVQKAVQAVIGSEITESTIEILNVAYEVDSLEDELVADALDLAERLTKFAANLELGCATFSGYRAPLNHSDAQDMPVKMAKAAAKREELTRLSRLLLGKERTTKIVAAMRGQEG